MSGGMDWQINRRRRDTTREVVKVEAKEIETLPEEWINEIRSLRRDLDALAEALKNSHEFVQPRGMQELYERVIALENQPRDITPSGGASPDDIRHLQQSIEEVAVAALKSLSVAVKRLDALEARIANIKLEIVEDTLGELQKSSA